MPTIPFNPSPTVAPAGASGVFQNIPERPGAFGATVGAAQQQLGRTLEGVGDVMAAQALQLQAEKNRSAVADAEIDATRQLNALQFDPESGFLARKGREAVDGLADAVSQAESVRGSVLQGAPNEVVKRVADPIIARAVEGAVAAMNRHARVESDRWALSSAEGVATAATQAMSLNYLDERLWGQTVGTLKFQAETIGRIKGEDPTAVEQGLLDRAWRARYRAWVQHDAVGAFTSFLGNREKMDPTTALGLEHQLFTAAAPALADQLLTVGGPGVVAPAVPGEKLPRGIRNNNPGLLQRSEERWDGEIPGSDTRYASFETPEAGIRAMGKTLLAYQDRHGLRTVAGIVSRWAPSTENDSAGYVRFVAKAMGVQPDQQLDLHDAGTLSKLARAIVTVENGAQAGARISDAQLSAGLDAALNDRAPPRAPGTVLASRDASIPTYSALVDALPPDQKLHVMQIARARAREAQGAAREVLKGRVQDTEAAYLTTGAAPNPPSEAEILGAYGQMQGPAVIRRLRETQALGVNIQQVKTLADRDIEAVLSAARPQPGDGYAQRAADFKLLEEAAGRVRASRRADPVGYAGAVGAFGVTPLPSLADPAAMGAELGRRAQVVGDIARDYGTAPALFTKPEAAALATALRGAPVELAKNYLGAIYTGLGGDADLMRVAMRQVAPDAPVLAVAGVYQGRGLRTTATTARAATDVSDLILRGNAILHPVKREDGSDHQGGASLIKMPEEKLLLTDWNARTGEAFKGREGANDLFQQTARSIYAALSAEDGDFSGVYDAKRWRSSIDLATGGIERHNGAEIVLPYGMPYNEFRDSLRVRTEALAKSAQPVATTAGELESLPLENVGDGRYLFRRGTGYIVTKDGHPLVVNMNAPSPAKPFVPQSPVQAQIPKAAGFAVTPRGAVEGIPGRRW